MASLKELLGEAYKDGMTYEDIAKALENMKLVDLSSGEYVSKGKLTDYEARMKKAEKALADKMSEEEKALAEQVKKEEFYKTLERENAIYKHTTKLSKTIKDEKVVEEIATLYAEGKISEAIDKQNEYIMKANAEMEKTIKSELLKTNPQPSAQSGGNVKTKEDIMAVKDAEARQKLIAENINLFQKN